MSPADSPADATAASPDGATARAFAPADPAAEARLAHAAFLEDFRAMSAFGATEDGGVERQAATPEHGAVRDWFADLLRGHGFATRTDGIGNLFGLREQTPGAPYLLMGSHLDSQPLGGKYDGAYGVLAAAHAAFRLAAHVEASGRALPFNLAVVDWFNEEGSRFGPSMMGSGVFTGKIPAEQALATTDVAGTSVAEALAAVGHLGVDEAPDVACYAEIHIEQGPVLEKEGLQIGLVDATWAAHKYSIAVLGAQAHTGATPMADRQDALYGAARAVVAVHDMAARYSGRGDDGGDLLHSSCGQLTVYPNSPVVVPREVRMHFDLRSPSTEVLEEADALLRQEFARIEAEANVRIETRDAHAWGVLPYAPDGVELARGAARSLGLSHRSMMTLAGHDSTNMKDVVPSVMLFVPSVDGVSHNERELTLDEDLVAGLDLLTEVAARMAGGALDAGGRGAGAA